MMVNNNGLSGERMRQLVPGLSVEDATVYLLVNAAPLLEEEGTLPSMHWSRILGTQSRSTGRSLGLGYPPAIVQSMRRAILVREKRYYLYTGIAIALFKVGARGGLSWHSSYLRLGTLAEKGS